MAQGQWARTRFLVLAAKRELEAEWPMTVRQLFYRLVSVQEVDNATADYKRVSRVLKAARERGEIPWQWIVDRSRPSYAPATWDGLEEYGEAVASSYRRNCWQEQPCHVEIWIEKDAVAGSISQVTDEFQVTVRAIRGFDSATGAHEVADLFRRIDKPKVVFYLGDHDPSGRDIERDVYARVQSYGGGLFKRKRLGIHAADIAEFNLPPLRVKETDSRTPGFLRRYSDKCVELDALPPGELRRRVRTAIGEVINRGAWEAALRVEEAERATTKFIAERLRSLPRADETRDQ